MTENSFDLIVLGAGPGGYVAAIRAAQLGKKAAIVEANHLGGICLNWGCIPTKALLRSSEVYHLIQHSDLFGIEVKDIHIHFHKIIERSRQVAAQLAKGIGYLMKKNKITVFDGFAQFKERLGTHHFLSIQKENKEIAQISAPKIIIATGARARDLPHIKADGKTLWTYREAMTPEVLPSSLLVIGSGAIGIEFASFYAAFGTKVTIVEIANRILPTEDLEISTLARQALEKRGITIMTSAHIQKVETSSQTIKVSIRDEKGHRQDLEFNKGILAVGIVGNTENIGLEKTRIQVEQNAIVTNEWCETAEKGIYAIGDVTAGPWLAHKASHEGIIAVEYMFGIPGTHPLDKSSIPGCTYSMPQIASVGLTEQAAKDKGYTIKVGRFPCSGNGKAITLNEPGGLVKVIFDEKTGALLGAHMIGPEVTEMIQGFAIAKTLETTEQELMQTVFPHPTLSEMMHEAVLDAYGRALNI